MYFFVILFAGFVREVKDDDMSIEIGTALYMAPEVRETSNYNESVDIFGYGCTLSFMFSTDGISKIQDHQKVITNLNLNPQMKNWASHIEQCRDSSSKRPTIDEVIKFLNDWVS